MFVRKATQDMDSSKIALMPKIEILRLESKNWEDRQGGRFHYKKKGKKKKKKAKPRYINTHTNINTNNDSPSLYLKSSDNYSPPIKINTDIEEE